MLKDRITFKEEMDKISADKTAEISTRSRKSSAESFSDKVYQILQKQNKIKSKNVKNLGKSPQ